MKKITLKFLMTALLLLGATNVLADEISWTGQADWTGIGGASISLTSGDYTVKVDKNNGGSNPTVNGTAKDLRAYAKATVTIEAKKNMNTIVFKISAQGKKRMTDITANTGTVNFDDKAWTLTWTGSASSVSFTVGEKATYGSDGESKAGQFDVDSPITVVAEGGGTYVAAPAFTPAPGTYTKAQNVTISVENGLTAYYSLNGSTTFNKYTAPITVSTTTTIEAYAQDADGNKSSTAKAEYTIVDLGDLNGSGTADDPYDVASAIKLINAGAAPATEVYVKGIVSSVDATSWAEEFKTLIYFISDDGTTANQLEVYRGKALANEGFESADALKTGDNVTVYGKLVIFGTTPEFTQGSYLYAWNSQQSVIPPAISPASGVYTEAQKVTITAESGLDIYYSLNGADAVKYTAPFQVDATSTIVAYTQDSKGNKSAEVTVTITINNGSGTINGDGTEANPYDVASAIQIITSGQATTDKVYVKGKISKIDSYNSTYKSITYWISDDGTTANQMQVYSGKGLDNTDFTAVTDLTVGDQVVVYGVIKLFNNSVPEFDKENYITELNGQGVQVTTYKSIAEAKAAATADRAKVELELSNVLVTYVNGQSNYIADATNGFLLFGKDLGYVEGQIVNTTVKGELYLYNGLPELAVSSVESVTVVSENNEIVPTVVEIYDLVSQPMKYSNMLVKMEGVSYDATGFSDRNVIIWQDGEQAVVRDNWNVAATAMFDTSKDYDVTGLMAIYTKDGATTVQIYPRTIEDLGATKKPIELVGDGTFENPYTVNDILQLYADGSAPEEDVWVKGYIVGCFKTSKTNFITDPKSEDVQPANVVIADEAGEVDVNKVAPVNLPVDPKDEAGNTIPNIRGKVNLKDNPDNLGKEVMFLGKIQAYFSVAGLKDVKDAIIDGEHANGIFDINADNAKVQGIYNIAGQRVNQVTRGGLYIINGKKVLVK